MNTFVSGQSPLPNFNRSFTAIDFETAGPEPWSICAVGLVRVEEGQFLTRRHYLVQPPGNAYSCRFSAIHGITPEHTLRAPLFDDVWLKIKPHIEGEVVVAHNGFRFDFRVLSATLDYYEMETPLFFPVCTYRIYRKGLARLCREHAIELDHHNPLSDANACAELFLKYQCE